MPTPPQPAELPPACERVLTFQDARAVWSLYTCRSTPAPAPQPAPPVSNPAMHLHRATVKEPDSRQVQQRAIVWNLGRSSEVPAAGKQRLGIGAGMRRYAQTKSADVRPEPHSATPRTVDIGSPSYRRFGQAQPHPQGAQKACTPSGSSLQEGYCFQQQASVTGNTCLL